jgi:hypothetical protein
MKLNPKRFERNWITEPGEYEVTVTKAEFGLTSKGDHKATIEFATDDNKSGREMLTSVEHPQYGNINLEQYICSWMKEGEKIIYKDNGAVREIVLSGESEINTQNAATFRAIIEHGINKRIKVTLKHREYVKDGVPKKILAVSRWSKSDNPY